MKYDDASWHYGGDYPKELPVQNAFTHIGIFLAWAIESGLAGELHTDERPEEIDALLERKMTGAEFLERNCDGKFTDEDLNEIGNKFAAKFYEDYYFDLYVDVTDPDDKFESVYHVPNSWETYEKVAPLISKAFKKWKKKNS
ncbi:MAG: hypothetical protein KJ630_10440 [Proteobacteria bacterium]|nr:hypothetical protein [Pseudomonadota bacterium]